MWDSSVLIFIFVLHGKNKQNKTTHEPPFDDLRVVQFALLL